MSEPYLALQVLMMPKDTNGMTLPGITQNTLQLTMGGVVIGDNTDAKGNRP